MTRRSRNYFMRLDLNKKVIGSPLRRLAATR